MSIVRTLIGNVKGPKGDTGETGATGPQGRAASIRVGSTTTATYGTSASVVNSGTEEDVVLDFTIPQGRPGEEVTDASGLTLNEITASSASYPTFTTGETLRVIFGKIQKFLSDLRNNFVSKSMMTTSTNVETAGQYVADAAVIKTLNDNSGSLASEVNSIKSRVDNLIGYGNTLRGKNIDNYNDTSHTGIYAYNGYSSGSDATTGTVPFTNALGLIFVYDNGFGGIMQVAFNTSTGVIYRRTYNSGAWNAWTASS